MALSDFTGLGNCIRAYLRSEGGPTRSGGDGTDATGWTDSSSEGVDATMATPTGPSVHDSPGDGNEGPVATHNGEHGFALGLDLSAVTDWTFGCTVKADSVSGFRNLFSSQGGSSEGSLYANGGTLTYEEGSTEASSFTMSTGTLYTVIFVANGTNYRLYVDGALEHTFTSIGTPGDAPSAVETAAYGGTGAPWDGDWWAIVMYDADMSADVSALHAALLEEAEGASVTLAADGGTISATGQDAALSAAIAAGQGSYALSGQDATFGQSIIADQGSVASTGQDTGLLVDRLVAADSGAVAVTGQDANLVAVSDLEDDFGGSGGLTGYTTVNESSLPDVTQANGRYLAELDDNTADVTTHFDADYGRFDYRNTTFPFDITIRNIGIGVSAAATQTSPTIGGGDDPYNFAGMQINNDPSSPTDLYQHFVVGFRGSTSFAGSGRTIEGKTTVSGSSSVNDIGTNAIAGTRADLRIQGSASKVITFSWSEPGAETWSTHTMPGSAPSWSDTVAIGPVTYAFGTDGVPFVGTADSIENTLIGVEAEQGSVAVAGQDTDFAAARLIAADQGSTAAAGQESGLLAGRALAADQGAASATGQSVDLLLGLLVAAEGGSFIQGGQDAEFVLPGRIAAELGTYVSSGQVADLLAGVRLEAEAGSLAASGQDALFASGETVAADGGAVALTGQDVVFALTRMMSAESGSTVATGITAALSTGSSVSFRNCMLQLADRIRGLAGLFGVRQYRVYLEVTSWSGGQRGSGTPTVTTTEITEGADSQPPKVTWEDGAEIAFSGESMGSVRIGPVTPNYSVDGTIGGTSLADLAPTPSNRNSTVRVRLTGPRFPSGAYFNIAALEHHRGYQYVLVVNRSSDGEVVT